MTDDIRSRYPGVAQWLHIDFGDGVTFENDPFETRSHWASRFHALAEPIETMASQQIAVDIRLIGHKQVLMRLVGDA